MNTINSTGEFDQWVDGLADIKARAAVYVRIKCAAKMWAAIREERT
jgi:putative component of toxin-antitoxin plasmid stabilization module